MNVNTSLIASDLYQIRESLKALKSSGARSTEVDEFLKQDEEISKNPTTQSMEIYKKKAGILIKKILEEENPRVHLNYLLKALHQNKNISNDILVLIQKHNLENQLTVGDIRTLLSVFDDVTDIKKDPIFSILKKIDNKIVFDLRYDYNFYSQYDKDTNKLPMDILNLEDETQNLIDKKLLEKKLGKLRGDIESVTIEKIIEKIVEIPGGKKYIKSLILSGEISLYRSTFGYSFPAIKLLATEEKLDWCKNHSGANILPYLIFSKDKGLLTLLGTENEILNLNQIKELFFYLTAGKDLNSTYLKEIPDDVIEELGSKRNKKIEKIQ